MTLYKVSVQSTTPLITPQVMTGQTVADLSDLENLIPGTASAKVDEQAVKELLQEGLVRFGLTGDENAGDETKCALDQWLAARVHSLIRLQPRHAHETGFWCRLVLLAGIEYTRRRWGNADGGVTMYRYTGDFKRNALSRLWWFAEMARNGSDYGPVVTLLEDAGAAQYAFELRYSMYRPAIQAFARVAAKVTNGRFDKLKALSKRINAYSSLRSIHGIALAEEDFSVDDEWYQESPSVEDLAVDELPMGPMDRRVEEGAIVELTNWFQELLTAPMVWVGST